MDTNAAEKEPSKLKVNSNLKTLGLPSLSDSNLREMVRDLSSEESLHRMSSIRIKYRNKGLSDTKIDKLEGKAIEILSFLSDSRVEVEKKNNFLLVLNGALTEARSELESEKKLIKEILTASNQKYITQLERGNDELAHQKLKLSNANENLRGEVTSLKTKISKLQVTVNILQDERNEFKKEYRRMRHKYYNLQWVQTARKESRLRRVQRICRHSLRKKYFCYKRKRNLQEAKSK
jgi:hypothetical protein